MSNPLYGQNKADSNLNGFASAISASASWDAAAIADGDEVALDVTVTGAALGDFVLSSLSIDIADLVLAGAVTGTDTVTLILANNTGGEVNLDAATAYVLVVPKQ